MTQVGKLPDILPTNLENLDWQSMTISTIQNKLFGNNRNIFLSKDFNYKASNLAVVYGPAQIGKTTLILFLLGINPEYKFTKKTVYELLCGSSEPGNSSTATAILYERSEDDYFYIDGKVCKNEKKIIEAIDDVRAAVENNTFKKDIIRIAIPKNAFLSTHSDDNNNIRYLDMPGVDSKNKLEIPHVDSIYKQYLNLASVILIVCNANQIQSLSVIADASRQKLHRNWECNERYMILILHAFGLGSIVEKNMDRKKHNITFYDFFRDFYTKEIKGTENLPKCSVPVYTFDLGSSFESLKNKLSSADFNEARETNLKMAEHLRSDIQAHHGNELSSIIKELENIISTEIENEIEETDLEIQNLNLEISKYNNSNNSRKKMQINEDNRIKELDEKIYNYSTIKIIANINFIKEKFVTYTNDLNIQNYKNEFDKIIKHTIIYSENKMKTKLFDILYRIKEYILARIQIDINTIISINNTEIILIEEDVQLIKQNFEKYMNANDTCVYIDVSSFSKKERNEYNLKYEAEKIEKKILSNLKFSFDAFLDKKVQDCVYAKNLIQNDIKKIDKNTNNTSNKISILKKEKKEMENKKVILQQKLEENKSYLEDYKNTAKNCFELCRNQIIKEINETKDKEQKLFLSLLLGAQENSFNKFQGELKIWQK